jgi:hypothetical protein
VNTYTPLKKGLAFAKGDGKWTLLTQQLFYKGPVAFLNALSTKAPGTDQPTCANKLRLAAGASWGTCVVLMVVLELNVFHPAQAVLLKCCCPPTLSLPTCVHACSFLA